MPIPALQNEEWSAEGRARLHVVGSLAEAPRGDLLYPRALAHLVDACVLAGFSIYTAKIFSVLLVSLYGGPINATGKVATSVFRHAFAYSSSQLFAASFASLSILYFVALPLIFGRTPGQAVLGLRVTGESGEAPTMRQLVLRLGGVAFNYGSGGILCILGLRKRDGQFVHDIVSGSKVIRE